MGKLTTHVLDTARGKPAEGLHIDVLFEGSLIRSVTTNADGRVDRPLLEGSALKVGKYELRFHAGNYLRASTADLVEPLFLDTIPISFGISNADQHYHVPLLLSAFGYSTYRGS